MKEWAIHVNLAMELTRILEPKSKKINYNDLHFKIDIKQI
jgi:hypothetical protein